MKPGGTGYRVLFIKRTFSPWMVIDEFYLRACHVTLGSNVIKLHSALERKPCTSYQTYFSFPSPAPFPTRMRTRKNGWLARLPYYMLCSLVPGLTTLAHNYCVIFELARTPCKSEFKVHTIITRKGKPGNEVTCSASWPKY